MSHPWQPERTVLTVTGRAGDTFALVLRVGGGCGITHNGEPLHDSTRPDDGMDDCLSMLLRLAGLIP